MWNEYDQKDNDLICRLDSILCIPRGLTGLSVEHNLTNFSFFIFIIVNALSLGSFGSSTSKLVP
uniref:Uncharacterized protein n=1 Tax=Meloidogyne enterolobii TaxID=390850 RepID=A0A6V7VLW6_MELEN|nr:unnamed protein product [Meloidogyne enterolobii]